MSWHFAATAFHPQCKPIFQFHIECGCFRHVANSVRAGRSAYRQYPRRVFQYPGKKNDIGADAVFCLEFWQQCPDSLRLRNIFPKHQSERVPRHRPDVSQLHIVERAIGQCRMMCERKLDLVVRDQCVLLDQIGLAWCKIRKPEIEDFPVALEYGNRFRNFFPPHQWARPVQKEQVEMVGSQIFKRLIHRPDDILW